MLFIIYNLLSYLVSLLAWAVIIQVILSLLLQFNVLDRRNRIVWTISDFFSQVTEPFLRPIRRRLPQFGGWDLSPWILVIALRLVVQPLLTWLYLGLATGQWQR